MNEARRETVLILSMMQPHDAVVTREFFAVGQRVTWPRIADLASDVLLDYRETRSSLDDDSKCPGKPRAIDLLVRPA
jgi:hypothetical protein